MQSFLNRLGNCCVLFSTTAFGRGVDVPNIHTVSHFGPLADMDDYFQEHERARCDALESNAILYLYPDCLMGHVSIHLKVYYKLENMSWKGTAAKRHAMVVLVPLQLEI